MPTIAFIVPLRSPESCNNWKRVSRLCMRTLGSLSNQSSDDWICILVCNEPPEGADRIQNLTIVRKNFSIPTTHGERMRDKQLKKKIGFECAMEAEPKYVMALDADDLLHSELVAYLSNQDSTIGWQIRSGYDYEGGRLLVRRFNTFDKSCGSSSILPACDLEQVMIGYQLPHNKIRDYYHELGRPLKSIPFIGAVHILGTGDNCSRGKAVRFSSVRRSLRTILGLRFLNARIIETYNIKPLRVE